MKEKQKTPPKKKLKSNFKQSRLHSDKMSDYTYDKKPSVVMKAKSPEKENRADIDLRKLVSKRGVFPSADANVINERNTNDRRYK